MANNTAHLIPKHGLIVRDPVTAVPLPADGAAKPLNSYWLRRLRDGDVEKGKPKPAAKPAAAASKKTD